ncbi:protein OSB2, chloroplastic-like [Cynara cardunculus var. scolymus]|uniref:protein OSB2, chloroplastic-like n=1 Tax=Cynara cardunculus var. scolymus TaxID=59895 RepID=UPI000D62E483|nr:protein OSB2, chloroplastic-like [Cynara cardunculus var. scolymus]
MAIIPQNLLTNNLQWVPNKPLSNTLNHSRPITRIFLCSTSSSLDKKYSGRLGISTHGSHVKSSFDYNNHNGVNTNNGFYEYEQGLVGNGQQYPRPSEVPWKKEFCNSVQLIGIVGTPVEFKQLSSGKVLAWSRLAVKKSATDTTWINLTFWDELAHVASQHVEKGQQIYVSGRLVSDTVDSDDGKQQTYYKVVVQQLNFVERSSSSLSYDGDSNFNSSSGSSSMTTGKKQKNYAANGTGSTEELWQAFFANPTEWWDNRKNKRSPNYPDFKHKDTGEALWVEGRYNPSWVKSQLSILDSRMESFHNQNANKHSDFMFGDNLTSY